MTLYLFTHVHTFKECLFLFLICFCRVQKRSNKLHKHFRSPCKPTKHVPKSLMMTSYSRHFLKHPPTRVAQHAHPLLPRPAPHLEGRMTLLLDLDETLVHSSLTPMMPHDYHVRGHLAPFFINQPLSSFIFLFLLVLDVFLFFCL